MTWMDFKREYYQQYFTDCYQDQKRREFTELKQDSMSVADYEAAFIDLSRFAYVANEREKCRLFQDGLNLPIQAKTRMQQYGSYSDLVQGALEAEDIEEAFSSRRQDKGKKKLSFSSAKSWFRKFRGSQRQR